MDEATDAPGQVATSISNGSFRRRVDLHRAHRAPTADRVPAPTALPRPAPSPMRCGTRRTWSTPWSAIFVKNRRLYGVRKLWRLIRRAGHQIGRDQVARLIPNTSLRRITEYARHSLVHGQAIVREFPVLPRCS
ncbi:IS3 family transposase [Variovorax sp. PBS-H4]|uniref:IS3 family transposase n=1 Tax=Variovorax sp. PBS-H4 TaxID=434008 RepID=UPI0013A58FDA